jgi:hypothetical protein
VDLPLVLGIDVPECRRDAALGHDGVRLAEQRLADEPDRRARGLRLDRRAQPGSACPDDEHVDGVRLDLVQPLRAKQHRSGRR